MKTIKKLFVIASLLLVLSGCKNDDVKEIDTPEVEYIENLIPSGKGIFIETPYEIYTFSLDEYTIKLLSGDINEEEWEKYIDTIESDEYGYWKLSERPNELSRVYLSSDSKYKLDIIRFGHSNFGGYITVSVNEEEEENEE